MDGDPVEEEPSQKRPITLAELFDSVFPQYLAIGMSGAEYWHGDPKLVRAYRKAWEMKRDQRNWEMWLQGMYYYDALVRVAPVMRAALSKEKVEPGKYPTRPYPLTEKQMREQEEERQKTMFDKFLADMKASDRRQKQRTEGEAR